MTRTRKVKGFYNFKGCTAKKLNGSRREVWNGSACKTPYGLTRNDLHYNKNGRIVSKKKHILAKKENRLVKHGYHTKKGEFGFVYKKPKHSPKHHSKSHKKKHSKSHKKK